MKTAEFRNPPVTPVVRLQEEGPVRVEGREAAVKASDVAGILPESTYRFEQSDYAQLQRSPAFQRGFINMDKVWRRELCFAF